MANDLNSLLARVDRTDAALAAELRTHIARLSRRREFGLNFEKHQPETVELRGRPVRVGDKARFLPERGSDEPVRRDSWIVTKIDSVDGLRTATLQLVDGDETAERAVEDLAVIADFRDPIYPGLRSTGRVERGGTKPFHAVINAENFHALEALMFTCRGKVDAIYIDPPYNTRDKDWKYNNDYVDGDDDYKHSKWLSMMERRLKLAKRLLNPDRSVLVVTIDEKEYLRLGLLLEQTFPGVPIRMISTVINPKGTGRTEGFRRVDEYAFIVRFGAQPVISSAGVPLGSRPVDVAAKGADDDSDDDTPPPRIGLDWQTARRRDLASVRPTRPAQFYPIYVNESTGLIEAVGEAIPRDQDRHTARQREGCVAVFPVRDDGTEMNWGVTAPTFIERWQKGYARAGRPQPGKPQPYIIQYLKSGSIKDIDSGRAVVEGRNEDGSVIAFYGEAGAKAPPTQWNLRSHNAEHYGTKVLRALLPDRNFPFPKSLYAVEDMLRLFVGDKPDAVVLDFFAGSGTTTHAVMRLNKQDGGRRRSILVTNNEVNDQESRLQRLGLRPGDADWEAQGICNYITKPRIHAAVTGQTPDGKPVKGDYRFADSFPMADGFAENVEFFDLTYENPSLVELDMAFEAVAPLLWLRAGAEGRRIEQRAASFDVADKYGVLFAVDGAAGFLKAVDKASGLRVVFVVTDDEPQFQAVADQLPAGVEAVRLYESYLRTFEINTGRS